MTEYSRSRRAFTFAAGAALAGFGAYLLDKQIHQTPLSEGPIKGTGSEIPVRTPTEVVPTVEPTIVASNLSGPEIHTALDRNFKEVYEAELGESLVLTDLPIQAVMQVDVKDIDGKLVNKDFAVLSYREVTDGNRPFAVSFRAKCVVEQLVAAGLVDFDQSKIRSYESRTQRVSLLPLTNVVTISPVVNAGPKFPTSNNARVLMLREVSFDEGPTGVKCNSSLGLPDEELVISNLLGGEWIKEQAENK